MFSVITLHEPVMTPVSPLVGLKVFSVSSFFRRQQEASESALSEM